MTKSQGEEVLAVLYLIAALNTSGWFAVVLYVLAGLNAITSIVVAVAEIVRNKMEAEK
jgi:hypothetical protein